MAPLNGGPHLKLVTRGILDGRVRGPNSSLFGSDYASETKPLVLLLELDSRCYTRIGGKHLNSGGKRGTESRSSPGTNGTEPCHGGATTNLAEGGHLHKTYQVGGTAARAIAWQDPLRSQWFATRFCEKTPFSGWPDGDIRSRPVLTFLPCLSSCVCAISLAGEWLETSSVAILTF